MENTLNSSIESIGRPSYVDRIKMIAEKIPLIATSKKTFNLFSRNKFKWKMVLDKKEIQNSFKV